MKTYSRYDLPETITHNKREYKLDIPRTHLHQQHSLKGDNRRGCVLVKVLSRNLRKALDLHHKPYRPTEYIFYSMEAAKTRKAYEQYLNELYADAIKDYVTAQRDFGRWTKPVPKKKMFGGCHPLIVKHYNRKTLGELVRKYGPIEFQCGYQEWQPQ